ncbi:8722_t:CDS:1 [Racocetra persica]|uniref:8722_t:CDS:1 n=1 Tax=Racocetra persica TaxID=160502 RepID=A0ACA9PFR3_9GLOM|nr:8722_t:CDS:1 [Racocetra persica]
MLAWLKKCSNQQEEHDPFYKSLFYWRKPNKKSFIKSESHIDIHSIIIPTKLKTFFQNDNPEYYDNTTKTLKRGQMIPYLFYRLQKLIFICGIQEIVVTFLEIYVPTVPSQSYPLRIFNYLVNIDSSQLFISYFYVLYSYIYAGFLYINMSWLYEMVLLCCALIFCGILLYEDINKGKNVKIKNDDQFYKGLIAIKRWLISFLFETPMLFDVPYLSSSPKDFWSNRWQQMYHQSFTELAYKPTFNFIFTSLISLFSNNNFNSHLFNSTKVTEKSARSNSIKNIIFLIAHSSGVLAGFFLSGLFHEYVIFGLFGVVSGEQMGFFLFHAVVMIIWEGIGILFGNKRFKRKVLDDKKDREEKDEKDQMTKDRSFYINVGIRILQFIVWNFILIFSTPWMMEPYIRLRLFKCMPHLYCLI